MSKAFTRESDEADDAPLRLPGIELPAGVKNYMTPEGAARLRGEVLHLTGVTRPAAAASSDARALREVDQRLAFLGRRLDLLEVIDPRTQPDDEVRFGATVAVRDEHGAERRYRIVGVDEADPPHGAVSWRSPLAAALLGAHVGDTVTFRSPRGDEELEVVALSYVASETGPHPVSGLPAELRRR
jgi:transcription elongation factor GreB